MDPSKTKLINIHGVEVEHPLDLVLGEGFPRVLIMNGRVSEGRPSVVFVADDAELAKRNWTEMVYREQPAMFI